MKVTTGSFDVCGSTDPRLCEGLTDRVNNLGELFGQAHDSRWGTSVAVPLIGRAIGHQLREVFFPEFHGAPLAAVPFFFQTPEVNAPNLS